MKKEVKKNGEKQIISKAVKEFPDLFRGTEKANNKRASRLWHGAGTILEIEKGLDNPGAPLTITRNTKGGSKRVALKDLNGRGRRMAKWKIALEAKLREEYDRLRKCGMKFSVEVLRMLTLHFIRTSTNPLYGPLATDPNKTDLIIDHVTPRFIQAFMSRYRLVGGSQTGKLMTSPAKCL